MVSRFLLMVLGIFFFVVLGIGVYYSSLINDTSPSATELVFRTRLEKFMYKNLGISSMGGAEKFVSEVGAEEIEGKTRRKYLVFGSFKSIDLENSNLIIIDNDGTEYFFHVNLVKKQVDLPAVYLSVFYVGTDKIPTIQDLLVSSNGNESETNLLHSSESIMIYWNDDSTKEEVVSKIHNGDVIENVTELYVYDFETL